MPVIQWARLPSEVLNHLLDRLRDRKISAEDLYALEEWKRTSPTAPEGEWFKDFGSFKLCGEDALPKTFLTAEQNAYGTEIID